MSNTAENLPFALEWLNIATHESIEFGKFVAKYSLMHVFNTAVGAFVGGGIGAWIIHKGAFKEKHAIIGETMYVPSGEINPVNGEEYVDQVMITHADDFTYQAAFHGKVARQLVKKSAKASKLGTLKSPLIPSHFDEVVGKDVLSKFSKLRSSQWKSHMSGRLITDDEPHCHKLEGREYLETKTIFAIDVFEPSDEGNPYKVLYIPMSQLAPGALPKPENVRVKVGLKENGEIDYQYKPEHHLNQRLRTLMVVNETVNTSPETRIQWLEDYGVQVPTGRVLERPAPEPLTQAA